MSVKQIVSDSLIPIEQHFRISAGPGAGKTHWLVCHIKNVLQSSKRLGCYKKIACITYTNTAADTILKRLNFIADRVEVSTIHSFIYSNIIKPYISFIAEEYDFNVMKMDGHDDHVISRKRIGEWLAAHPNASRFTHPYTLNQMTRIENNIEALGNWLSSLSYVFNAGQLEIIADNSKAYYMDGAQRKYLGKTTCLDKLTPGLIEYKRLFWRKGILHHDDVLYFGYILLTKYPFLVTVLRAKYPYFFVDEFQDTSPIQAALLNLIGQNETIVGIIGDKAQSIYSFQGASPEHFTQFTLSNLENYLIADNRRSTNLIVNVLNHIRTDINQTPVRNVVGTLPVLFIGKTESVLIEAMGLSNSDSITTLSWDNITSNAMKRQLNSSLPTHDLISYIYSKDSNRDRSRIIISCINAVELAKQKRFKEAIKEMERNFRNIRNKDELKKTAFRHLFFLLSEYDNYRGCQLYDFYNLVRTNLRTDITNLTRGVAMQFYTTHTYEQLAVCVKIVEDNSPSRTIHKSKGDEFENVLVILKSQSRLGFILNPDLSKEEHRLFYVAVSRSRERLYIAVPDLDTSTESMLSNFFEIRRIS